MIALLLALLCGTANALEIKAPSPNTGTITPTSITAQTGVFSGVGVGPNQPILQVGSGGNFAENMNGAIVVSTNSTNIFHAFQDLTTSSAVAPGDGYSSFDTQAAQVGPAVFSHLAGYQARMIFSGLHGLGYMDSFVASPTQSSTSTITSARGLHVYDPNGTGPISFNYGVFIEDMTRGTINYGVYSLGGLNHFAGNVGIGSGNTSPVRPLDVSGAGVVRGVFDVSVGSATFHEAVNIKNTLTMAENQSINITGASGSVNVFGSIRTNTNGTSGAGVYIGPTGSEGLISYNTNGNMDITPRSGFHTNITAGDIIYTATKSPASNAACTAGTFNFDANYLYYCVSSGVWKRAALTGGY